MVRIKKLPFVIKATIIAVALCYFMALVGCNPPKPCEPINTLPDSVEVVFNFIY